MNPAFTSGAAPPGYYGGPYLPSFNQEQFGYPYPCTPVPGNYPVPFPGYGGPYPQPFFGPPQPCSSIPYAYGPHPGMFPPGYMVPQQAYPQPGMYGGPPMPPPFIQSQDGGAVQSSTMSPNKIPDNSHVQEQRNGSTLMRPGDDSSCASDRPVTLHHQQQVSTVSRKFPPGFSQIPSGDMSPSGIQWNTMVSHAGLHLHGISKSEDIEDKDDSEGRSVELRPPSSEYSTTGCQKTPDAEYTSNCQNNPDLTSDTQLSRSDALPEHSNESVVNALASSNLQMSSYKELVTDENKMATSKFLTLPVQEEEPISKEETGEEAQYPDSFSSVSNEASSVPATAVYVTTTESDTTDGPTRFTWIAANKESPLTYYRECLVGVFLFVDHGLGIPSGLPLENKCWVVPWPITLT